MPFPRIEFERIKPGDTLGTIKGHGGYENHTENLVVGFHNLLVFLKGLDKKIDPLFKVSLR